MNRQRLRVHVEISISRVNEKKRLCVRSHGENIVVVLSCKFFSILHVLSSAGENRLFIRFTLSHNIRGVI